MRGSGITMICFGLLLLVIAIFGIETSVASGNYLLPDRVYNVGRIQAQNMTFMAGLASVIGGIILLAASAIQMALRPAITSPEEKESAGDEKNTPDVDLRNGITVLLFFGIVGMMIFIANAVNN